MFWTIGAIVGGSLVAVYLFYKFCIAPWKVLEQYGIKGPRPVPIFGNYLQFRTVGGIHQTLKYYEMMKKKYGPVCGFYLGRRMRILLFDKEIMYKILTTKFESFRDRPQVYHFLPKPYAPNTLFSSCGDDWKLCRYYTNPTSTPENAKKMMPLLQKSVETLLEHFELVAKSDKSVNVYSFFSTYTMDVILNVYIGVESNLQKGESNDFADAALGYFNSPGRKGDLLLGVTVMSNFPWLEYLGSLYMRHTENAGYFKVLYYSMMKEVSVRRVLESARKEDMLQLLMDSEGGMDSSGYPFTGVQGKLSDYRTAHVALGNMFGSYENTANTIGFAAYLLAIHPDVQEQLQGEIDKFFDENEEATLYEAATEIRFLDNVIKEVMRVYPVAPRVSHECVKDTTINGVSFPKGSNIIIPIYFFQHDPDVWDNPEKFDPDRFSDEKQANHHPLSFIPFSYGPRACPAIEFCLLIIKASLVQVLRSYTFVRGPETEVPLQVFLATVLNPTNGIFLKVSSRN